MYEEYHRRCKAEPRSFNFGDCWLWEPEGLPWVFNLGIQEGYWRSRASYEAIETALLGMVRQADDRGITSIAIPRIGVGYGGLSWKKVRAIVEAVFEKWPGTLVVYEDFVPQGATPASAQVVGPPEARTSLILTVSDPPPTQTTSRTASQSKFGFDRFEPEVNEVKEVINFYSVSEEYGCFSNFSPHRVWLKGKTWPTSEHYFQAQKFAGFPDENEVGFAKTPLIAARMGRSRKRPLRKDWESVQDSIMHEAVLAKFIQHADLCEVLLATGDVRIVEHTENDAYWGDGGDGRGKNRLGQILMRVRDEIRGRSDAKEEQP